MFMPSLSRALFARCSNFFVHRATTISFLRRVPSRAFSLTPRWLESSRERRNLAERKRQEWIRRNDPEERERQKQKKREYRKRIKENEPEKHERQKQKKREYYQRIKENEPEKYEREMQKRREYRKRIKENEPHLYQLRLKKKRKARLDERNDPERYQLSLKGQREWVREKYQNDPQYREVMNQKSRVYHNKQMKEKSNDSEADAHEPKPKRRPKHDWKDKNHRYHVRRLHAWLYKNERARGLQWRTHELEFRHPEKAKHFCSGCGYVHFGGKSIWWRRKEDPTLYDCTPSFASDWSRALPIGYEHIVFDGRKGPKLGN